MSNGALKLLAAAAGNAGASFDAVDVFSPTTYTGNSSTQSITNDINLSGEGGLVWIKQRDSIRNHFLVDTNRGVNKTLNSDRTAVEQTTANSVTAFNSNGFSLGSEAGVNESSGNFVSWTFRQAPGFFDVVTWIEDGSTTAISHNLGATPQLAIVKAYHDTRSGGPYITTSNWSVDVPLINKRGYFHLTAALENGLSFGTYSSTSVSNFGGGTEEIKKVAYLFATVDGISKVGTYTGSGSTQTIDCGFSSGARFVMIKQTSGSANWFIWDSARGITSGLDNYLIVNQTAAETTNSPVDVNPQSSGFEVFGNDSDSNRSSETYLFLAIA